MGLGYRICEDDYDLQALTLTMNDIQKGMIKIEDVNKMIDKHRIKANVTCDDSCFCWELSNFLIKEELKGDKQLLEKEMKK